MIGTGKRANPQGTAIVIQKERQKRVSILPGAGARSQNRVQGKVRLDVMLVIWITGQVKVWGVENKCAIRQGRECDALIRKKCQGCSFYKTKERLEASRNATILRLKRLGIYDEMRDVYKGGL